jgi:hypothetical protein
VLSPHSVNSPILVSRPITVLADRVRPPGVMVYGIWYMVYGIGYRGQSIREGKRVRGVWEGVCGVCGSPESICSSFSTYRAFTTTVAS